MHVLNVACSSDAKWRRTPMPCQLTFRLWKMEAVESISRLNCCRMSFSLFIICFWMAPFDLIFLKFSSSSNAASALRSFLHSSQVQWLSQRYISATVVVQHMRTGRVHSQQV